METRSRPVPSETKILTRTAPRLVGNQSFQQDSPGRAREGVNPLAPVTRGGVGEQRAPRSFRRKPKSSSEQPSFHRERKPPTGQPRESARGCEPSRPRHPRGCRGAERPTLVPSETEILTRTAPRIVGNQSFQQDSPGRAREGVNPLASVTRGGVGEQSAPRSFRRKQKSSPEQPIASSGMKLSNRTAPGELERV